MYSQAMPNVEFVVAEPETSQVLFEVFLSSDTTYRVLTVTAEGVASVLFYTYVLSSIYILYKFQQGLIHYHKTLFNGTNTINAIRLFGIIHIAIHLHGVWDSLLQYIFTRIFGFSWELACYNSPQAVLRTFPRLIFPHPTSEGLDYWTKFLLILGSELGGFFTTKAGPPIDHYRQRKFQSTLSNQNGQVQAGLTKFTETGRHDQGFHYLMDRYQEVIDGFSHSQAGGKKGFYEQGVMGQNTNCTDGELESALEDFEDSYLRGIYDDIELSNAFKDIIKLTLIEGNKWWDGMESKVAQENGDEIDKQKSGITADLESSLVLVEHDEANLNG